MLPVMEQICDAIQYIHARSNKNNVPNFHGNLTPQNVYFSAGHQVKLRMYGRSNDWKISTVDATHTFATPFFSRNVLTGGIPKQADDVYSMGMLLFMGVSLKNCAFRTLIAPFEEKALFGGIDERTFATKLVAQFAAMDEGDNLELVYAKGQVAKSLQQLIHTCVNKSGAMDFHKIQAVLSGEVKAELVGILNIRMAKENDDVHAVHVATFQPELKNETSGKDNEEVSMDFLTKQNNVEVDRLLEELELSDVESELSL